jgi:hypothetical protein
MYINSIYLPLPPLAHPCTDVKQIDKLLFWISKYRVFTTLTSTKPN